MFLPCLHHDRTMCWHMVLICSYCVLTMFVLSSYYVPTAFLLYYAENYWFTKVSYYVGAYYVFAMSLLCSYYALTMLFLCSYSVLTMLFLFPCCYYTMFLLLRFSYVSATIVTHYWFYTNICATCVRFFPTSFHRQYYCYIVAVSGMCVHKLTCL
jgi:hypothetical protein